MLQTGQQVKFAKSLNEVYARNRLPAVGDLPPGERAMLRNNHLDRWATENLNRLTVVLRARDTEEKRNPRAGTPSACSGQRPAHPARPDHPSRPLQGRRGRGFASETTLPENCTLSQNRD